MSASVPPGSLDRLRADTRLAMMLLDRDTRDGYRQAAVLLAGHLDRWAMPKEDAHPQVVLGAAVYARACSTAGLHGPAVPGWAWVAHRGMDRLFPRLDEWAVAAAEVCADLLLRHGQIDRAAMVYRDLLGRYTDRGDLLAAAGTRVDIPWCLNAAGRCAAAIDEAIHGWQQWQRQHDGTDTRSGLLLVLPVAAMLTGCGRIDEAHQHVAYAEPILGIGSTDLHSQHQAYLDQVTHRIRLHRATFHQRSTQTAAIAAGRERP